MSTQRRHDLQASRHGADERRERLHAAVKDLQTALSASHHGPDERLSQVRASITRLNATLVDHVREAEAPDGFLAHILEEEPALGPRVAALKREHQDLLARSSALVEGFHGVPAPSELHAEAVRLIDQVTRHHHRSTALLFDAFEVDITAGD